MCKPKAQGGLGFRNLQAFNLAMLSKQAWRILMNPRSLIARIYKAKYFPYNNILGAKLGSNPSYAWRNIFNSLEIIRKGTRWRVGNGKMIHIWEDRWLPTPTTYKACSPQQDIRDFPMVSSLIDEVSRCWKVDRVQRFFLPVEAETILNIPLSYSLPEDSIMWMGNKRGVFTVKSAYYVALPLVQKFEVGECSYSDCRTRLWKTMWQLKLPAKIRIFSWKACMDGLPTRLNLARRGLNIETMCPQCETALESTSHALIHCEKLGDVWWSWHTCPVNLLGRDINLVDIALEILEAGSPQDLEILVATAWSIWLNRNKVVHESGGSSPSQIWNMARRTHEDYCDAIASHFLKQPPPDVGWMAPPPEFYKINVDGATASERNLSCAGVVIRDCKGLVIATSNKVLNGAFAAEVTEALAVEEGVRLAKELDLSQVIIESDSVVVVEAIGSGSCNGELGSLV